MWGNWHFLAESSDRRSEFLPPRHRKGRKDRKRKLWRRTDAQSDEMLQQTPSQPFRFWPVVASRLWNVIANGVIVVAYCYASHEIAIFVVTSNRSLMHKGIQWGERLYRFHTPQPSCTTASEEELDEMRKCHMDVFYALVPFRLKERVSFHSGPASAEIELATSEGIPN